MAPAPGAGAARQRRRLSLTIVLTCGLSRPGRVARTVTCNLAASASPLTRGER